MSSSTSSLQSARLSLAPKIVRLLPPPPLGLPPSLASQANAAALALATQTDLSTISPLLSASTNTPQTATTPAKSSTGGGPKSNSAAAASAAGSTIQRKITLHPSQPFLAYILESTSSSAGSTGGDGIGGSGSSSSPSPNQAAGLPPQHRRLVVQHTVTRQVVWQVHWWEVAAAVYGETHVHKLPAAARALGTILQLQFLDASTLYHDSGVTSSGGVSGEGLETWASSSKPWQLLAVQTTHRVILLNLRRGAQAFRIDPISSSKKGSGSSTSPADAVPLAQRLVAAHLCEKTLGGSIPSSNAWPLTTANAWHASWVLVGCSDGSLKCVDWQSMQTVKSIKGLGKGDWIVQIIPAIRYAGPNTESTGTTVPSASGTTSVSTASGSVNSNVLLDGKKRMVTVTKKGIAYLIELELVYSGGDSKDGGGGAPTLEIKPPLARLLGGWPENVDPFMEHALLQYDAHRDWITWLAPHGVTGGKGPPVLMVWNLKALHNDLVQQQAPGGSKILFKPDPTLSIQFPVASAPLAESGSGGGHHHHPQQQQVVTVHVGPIQTAHQEDTVLTTVVSNTGDLFLQAAVAHPHNTVQKVQATPVLGVSLATLFGQTLEEAGVDDDAVPSNSVLRVHAVTSAPLGATQRDLIVATNVGLMIVHLPDAALTIGPKAGGSRHVHLGAGLGSLGKSILTVQQIHNLVYSSVDVLKSNPVGRMEAKNPVVVYESPQNVQHLPPVLQKRPFRSAPIMMTSPSGVYLTLFWTDEFRYEILHIPTVLQRVGQRGAAAGGSSSTRSPVVATGTGCVDFCWIGDDDAYAILHNSEAMEQAALLVPSISQSETGVLTLTMSSLANLNMANLNMANLNLANISNLKDTAKNVANLGRSATKAATSVTLSATKAATSVTLSATKAATSVTLSATKAATSVTLSATKAATTGATKVTKTMRDSVNKGVKKSLGLFGPLKGRNRKTSNEDREDSIMDFTADDEESEAPSAATIASLQQMQMAATASAEFASTTPEKRHRRFVELRTLVAVESQSAELMASVAAATSSSLGEIALRGGNRTPPTVVFGGPVLCVGCKAHAHDDGYAHFYTRKKDETEHRANVYVSSGPTLPYPDLLTWDEDGRLCAVVVQNRVAVYLSEEPAFVLLGTVHIGSPFSPLADVTNVKFVHGVLYCCTWNSVHCVMLGDLEGGICSMDVYLLATSDVAMVPGPLVDGKYTGLAPSTIYLPIIQPVVLGYQSGSLLVSSLRGVHAIPMNYPLLRIGLLLASGQSGRAAKWFDAVPDSDHEVLASFLERRGHPELALPLPGLSLETIVDYSMKYGYVDRLEDVVETYGVQGLRTIDMGRGVVPDIFGPDPALHSVVVCVGAYLLAHGRVELTRRIATECLRSGENGRKDALFLGALLLPVNESDANRLIVRAVEEGELNDDWLIGKVAREYLLAKGNDRT